jgi:hypothetical protein
MKTKLQNLAEVFVQIQAAANSMEDISKGILAAIKEAKATTLNKFDAMVTEAYKANGWSQKAGRRSPGDTTTSAPRAVTFYVSNIRAAYRLKLKVLDYDLMQAIRDDIAKARKRERDAKKANEKTEEVSPDLAGVSIKNPDELTGEFWHDVLFFATKLPAEQQQWFKAQVQRAYNKCAKEAPPELLKAA